MSELREYEVHPDNSVFNVQKGTQRTVSDLTGKAVRPGGGASIPRQADEQTDNGPVGAKLSPLQPCVLAGQSISTHPSVGLTHL